MRGPRGIAVGVAAQPVEIHYVVQERRGLYLGEVEIRLQGRNRGGAVEPHAALARSFIELHLQQVGGELAVRELQRERALADRDLLEDEAPDRKGETGVRHLQPGHVDALT